jgi:uncharacterized protein
VKRALARLHAALVAVFLAPLRAYRYMSSAFPRRCKYEPTCSAYAEQAVRELGIIRGSIVAGWRLLRCNPWSHGGIDELADRSLFRPRTSSQPHAHPHDRAHA